MTMVRPAVAWTDLQVILKNDVTELARLATQVEAFVEANGCEDKLAFTINLCFDELITNTVSYGHEGGGYHPIFIGMNLAGGMLTIEIRDDGKPYDPFTEAPEPDLDSDIEDRPIGGLGVFFVKEFMTEVSYRWENGFNVVTLKKNLVTEGVENVEIKQNDVNGVTVLAPQNRVDSNTAGDFEKTLVSVLGAGKTKLIIDFGDLEYISSAGLRVVLIGAKTCKAKGGKLVLCAMKSHIREVFDVSGFSKILTIVADRNAALAQF